MSRYNVYKIRENSIGGLRDHLTRNKGYLLIETFTSGSYTLTTYFSEPQSTEIWWLKQYGLYFGEHSIKENQVYSGAIIAQSSTHPGYIIPLGKTHFYIQDYIDITFGLDLAEKIADDGQAKMKSLKSFGGNTSKAFVSYNLESSLFFSSGESAEYLKLKAKDKNKWGKSFMHFGTSVQISLEDHDPANLGLLLDDINTALISTGGFKLPLMKEVDSARSASLYSTLAGKILLLDPQICFFDYDLYGIDFIFSQQTHVKLLYKRIKSAQLNELKLQDIVDFITANGINLSTALQEIRVQVLIDGVSKHTTQLIRFIEYHAGDGKTFLYRGKWLYFNKSFIDNVHDILDRIPVIQFPDTFSKSEYRAWKAANPSGVRYPERFIIEKINASYGYAIYDREMDTIPASNKAYKIEICDLYDVGDNRIIVAKIGDPHEFNYAFDQAFSVLSMVRGNKYTDNHGVSIQVDKLDMLLIFNTSRTLTHAKNTKSIIFEIKLNELYRLAHDKNVALRLVFTHIT